MSFHLTHKNAVTIHVMEGTTVYLNSPTYILNATALHIKSYSNVKSSPDKARIIGVPVSSVVDLDLSPTKYHILDPTIDVSAGRLPSLGLSDLELQKLKSINSIIKLYNTGLVIENVQVTFDPSSSSTAYSFLNPFRNFERQLVIKNTEFHFQGYVLKADTSVLNLTMQNVKIDTQNLHQIMSLHTK